jgi:hypothetical protein
MLAHAVGGDPLSLPGWLVGYLGVALVLATAAALRATWPRARGEAEPVERPAAPPLGPGHVVGSVLYAGTVALLFAGPDHTSASFAFWLVVVVAWVGLPIVCLLAGDVLRVLNPFALPAAALGSRRADGRSDPRPDEVGSPPAWTAAAFLAVWTWYLLAYHDQTPTSLGVLLVVYAALAVAGGVRWGSAWLHTGEAFGAISAAVGRVGLRGGGRRTVPVAGTVALAVVWIGATAFDGFTYRTWWQEVLGTSTGWARTFLSTVGLVWITAIAGGLFLAVVRLAERGQRERDAERRLAEPLGWALVPMAVAWFLGHELTLLLAEGQSAYALASDPLGRGWDLFGTITYAIDYSIATQTWVAWVQAALVAAGHVGAVVALHELALERLPARAAMRTTWAMAVVASASIAAAALLVLA